MRTANARLMVLALSGAVLLSAVAFAAEKKYQVTGKVLELTDKLIVVQKDDDKWEIDRTSATKVEGNLKVGAAVTIHYHMVADSVDVKSEGSK